VFAEDRIQKETCESAVKRWTSVDLVRIRKAKINPTDSRTRDDVHNDIYTFKRSLQADFASISWHVSTEVCVHQLHPNTSSTTAFKYSTNEPFLLFPTVHCTTLTLTKLPILLVPNPRL